MGQKVNPNGLRLGINKDWQAKWYAKGKDFSKNLEKDVSEIEVIHGFNNGTKLLDWIRKKYNNKKICQKIITMNRGITIIKVA